MLQNNPKTEKDVLVPYLKALHVLWGKVESEDLPEMFANHDDVRKYGITSGDLLVCEGGEVGRAGIVASAPVPCIIQNALHRVRAKVTGDIEFLLYVLHAANSSGWFDVLCNKATIAHFTHEKFASLQIPIPPSIEEQRIIAGFLNHKTEYIDTLIAKKELQIRLMREKCDALINHTITKGLDPNVPMKDSGIEYLVKIPEHWKKNKIKYLADYINGYPFKPTDWSSEGKEIIRIENLNSNEAIGNRFPEKLDERYLIKKGDILLSWSASLGVYIWDREEGWLNQHIFKVIPKTEIIDNRYYIWLAKWFIIELLKDIHGSTMQHLTKNNFGKFVVYLPLLQEQNTIAAFLNHNTKIIDDLIARIEKQIELLKEKRYTLISYAVKGKIDVRKEVA